MENWHICHLMFAKLRAAQGFFSPQCLFCYLANRLCESSFKFCHSWFVSTQASVGWCEMFHGLSGRVQSKPSPWNGVWKSFPLIKIELDPAISFRIIFVYTGYSLLENYSKTKLIHVLVLFSLPNIKWQCCTVSWFWQGSHCWEYELPNPRAIFFFFPNRTLIL